MKGLMKKVLTVILASVMVLSMLTACGTKKEEPAPAPAEAEAPAVEEAEAPAAEEAPAEESASGDTIKWAVSQYIVDWAQDMATKFEAEKGKKVEVIEVSGEDTDSKMMMMMQSPETAPDVLQNDGFMVKPNASAGLIANLDEYIAGWDDFSKIVPAILENGRGVDGSMYGIPLATDAQGFWYDKDVFAAAGLPVPFEPKSWDEMLEAARTLKEKNADNPDFMPMFVYTNDSQDASMRTFQLLYNGTGGDLYDGASGKWIIDKENITKTLDFVNSIHNVDKLGGPMGVITAGNVNELVAYDYLMKGNAGIMITVDLLVLYKEGFAFPWPEALDHIAYAKIPTIDGGGDGFVSISGGHTWAIPENANNKDGGWELIEFIMSYDNNLDYLLTFGGLSVRTDVAEASEYLNQDFSVIPVLTDMVNYTHVRPAVDGYTDVSLLYSTMVEEVVLGASPEDAYANFEAEMDRAMGADKIEVK